MAIISEVFPVLVLFVLALALLLTPPAGQDVILPTARIKGGIDLMKSPKGNAFWTTPASSHWPSSKNEDDDKQSSPSTTNTPVRTEHDSKSSTLSTHNLEFNTKRLQYTSEFQMLISHENTQLSSIKRARELLNLNFEKDNKKEYYVDCSIDLRVPHMRPQGVMVRLIDIYLELQHDDEVLVLMSEYLARGGEANPSEPESGIDVLTRAMSLGSLRVARLIEQNGGKLKRTLGWAATVRPDIAVGFVAAVSHQLKSVSLSMDLFRLRHVADINNSVKVLPQSGLQIKDLRLGSGSFGKLMLQISKEQEHISANLARHGEGGVGTALDELTSQLFKILLHAGAPLQHLSYVNQKDHASNTVLHVLVESYTGLVFKVLLQYLKTYKTKYEIYQKMQNNLKQNVTGENSGMHFISDVRALYNVLKMKNQDNRTPMEYSLLLHGNQGMVTELVHKIENFCFKIIEENENSNVGSSDIGYKSNNEEDYLNIKKFNKKVYGNARNIYDSIYNSGGTMKKRVDGGGWFNSMDGDEDSPFLSEACDVDEWFYDPSSRQFDNMYIKLNRPVIIRGAVQRTNFNTQQFTKQFLLRYQSQINIFVGEIPYAKQFGMKGSDWTLGDFINSFHKDNDQFQHDSTQEQFYAFDSDPCNTWMNCDIDMLPQFVKQLSQGDDFKHRDSGISNETSKVVFNPQFFLGDVETGAPFHYHFDAVNVLVYGQKEWFLTKPEDSIYSVESPAKWAHRMHTLTESKTSNENNESNTENVLHDSFSNLLNKKYDKEKDGFNMQKDNVMKGNDELSKDEEDLEYMSKIMRCTQQSGDVMLVPKMWGHATFNTQPSIGVAFELKL